MSYMKTKRAALLNPQVSKRTIRALLCGVVATTFTRADFINFDPDGLNNPNGTGSLPAVTISSFDQAVGNALAVGGVSAIGNFRAGAPAAGNQFEMYYQATLQGYGGGSPPPPNGINSTFQLTFD